MFALVCSIGFGVDLADYDLRLNCDVLGTTNVRTWVFHVAYAITICVPDLGTDLPPPRCRSVNLRAG